MPRAGLSTADVVAAGAQLADDIGFANLAMAPLAERLGVRTPSLYKHIDSLADLQHAVATLAMRELAEALRDAMQGRAGRDALAAFAATFRAYVIAHPGRYTASVGAEFTGTDDPLYLASAKVLESMAAVLRGYDIPEPQMDHALRTLRCVFHGFATIQAANGFQWTGDPETSFDWMIDFLDRGLSSPR